MDTNRPAAAIPANRHNDAIRGLAGYADLADADKTADYNEKVEVGYELAADLIQRNVFVTGLSAKLRQQVLSHHPATFLEARDLAIDYERNMENPIKNIHISQVEEGNSEDEVNEAQLEKDLEGMIEKVNKFRLKKGKSKISFNKNGGGGHRQNQANNGVKDPNVICRYCKKKGHMQKTCFKRQRENGKMLDANGQPYRSANEAREAETAPGQPQGSAQQNPFGHLAMEEVHVNQPQSFPQVPLNW
jgi:hypothetical protein